MYNKYLLKTLSQNTLYFLVSFLLLIITSRGYSQCVNADFSSGDFTNWTGSTGQNISGIYSNIVTGLNIGTTNSLPSNAGQQTIINSPATDPNTGNALSVLPPLSSSCCRLGNENTNYEAERLEYTYNPSNSNCVFAYQYAVVLEDPSHALIDQPKFVVSILDASSNIIDTIVISAQAGLQGFQDATHAADGETTRWKDWSTAWIDLTSYIGQNVTIQFTTYDCAQGAHFGYAYISCFCSDQAQLVEYCQGNTAVIQAPSLFTSYLWSTGDTTSIITIINPVYGDSVSCVCITATNDTVVFDTTITVDAITNLTVNNPVICSSSSATLIASGNYTYYWNTGASGQSITVSPTITTIYTVTATNSSGCTATAIGTVTVSPFLAPDICIVTVDTSSNHNLVIWEKPATLAIDQYYIYRESSISGIYNLIGNQSYSDYSTYLDTASNTIQQPYRYELAIYDTCGSLSQQSSYHQTVHLTVSPGNGGSWNLIWNDYIGFTFSTYNIYRGTSNSNMTLLNSVSSSVTSYTDVTPPPGVQYYLVEAVKSTPCNPSLKSGDSFSLTISNVAITYSVGINDFYDDENIRIYPNPNRGIFTISNLSGKTIAIEISDALGQIIYTGELKGKSGNIDLSIVSKGIYYISLKTENKTAFKKIVIQ